MPYRFALIIICSTLLLPAAFCAQATLEQPQALSKSQFGFIDVLVQQHIDEKQLVGAVTSIWQDGQVIHRQAYGLRDRDSTSPTKTNTIFRIHSFTKAITTTAAMMLWEQGKFQLDDPVKKYLPKFANQQVYDSAGNRPLVRPMTVRDLMRHTSGLVYGNEHGSELERLFAQAELHDTETSLEEFADRLAMLPLAFSPGEKWHYGVSTDLLGRLIEVWSAQPFEEFLRSRILVPLAMNDTDFFVPPEKLFRLATLYVSDEERTLEPDYGKVKGEENYVPTTSPTRCSPGGGLFSTANDYGTFLQMILAGGELNGNRLLKSATVAIMTADQLPEGVPGVIFGEELRDGFKFGLGFNVITGKSQWDPHARVGEFGWGGAASCHYWVWPQKNLIVITLESTKPYNRNLEQALKGKIYEAFD